MLIYSVLCVLLIVLLLSAVHESLGTRRPLRLGLDHVLLLLNHDGSVGLVSPVRLDGFESDELTFGILNIVFDSRQ